MTAAGSTPFNRSAAGFFVFGPGDTYQLPADASFFEVAIKPDHPPVKEPPEIIPPAKNTMLYEGERFFIYEESLTVGDVRPRHSHCQRVEIRLNNGPMMEQTFDPPRPPMLPGIVNWREPVIHKVRNVGDPEALIVCGKLAHRRHKMEAIHIQSKPRHT